VTTALRSHRSAGKANRRVCRGCGDRVGDHLLSAATPEACASRSGGAGHVACQRADSDLIPLLRMWRVRAGRDVDHALGCARRSFIIGMRLCPRNDPGVGPIVAARSHPRRSSRVVLGWCSVCISSSTSDRVSFLCFTHRRTPSSRPGSRRSWRLSDRSRCLAGIERLTPGVSVGSY